MRRLSEPGPLGMRAEHWYDFGSLAGNSDLFVQVAAHQHLRVGQITPFAKPTGDHGDTDSSPAVLGEHATMEKTTQRFQKIASTLADLNAESLNVQIVNDLLSVYVGAASQHALRMSFVPEQEAQNFDRQVLTFWSRLMHAP